jgi:hypothetical protein
MVRGKQTVSVFIWCDEHGTAMFKTRKHLLSLVAVAFYTCPTLAVSDNDLRAALERRFKGAALQGRSDRRLLRSGGDRERHDCQRLRLRRFEISAAIR